VNARARAPGKTILAGEHAVVYGYSALAMPVPEAGVEVEIDPSGRWLWEGANSEGPDDIDPGETLGDLVNILVDAMYEHGVDVSPPIGLRVRGGVRSGGLGTSAALCTALVRALLVQNEQELSPGVVALIANEGEELFHGTPSGLDAALTSFGRPILYRKGHEPTILSVQAPLHFVVAASVVRSSTKDVVAAVAKARQEDSTRVEALMASMGAAAEEAAQGFIRGDIDTIAASMQKARIALKSLDLEHPVTEAIRAAALQAGALEAKLTGAGRGGAVLALAPSSEARARIQSALNAHPDCSATFGLTLDPDQRP